MSRQLRLALYSLTGAAWLVLALSTTQFGRSLSDAELRLTVAVAVVGSLATLIRRLQVPVDEVYRVGKTVGRAELLAEIAAGNVVHLPADRPDLRVVGDVRDQA